MEDLQLRHRNEKKDLQNKIQALKKTVTKGDKKKKKEVSEEITRLETEIQSRHCQELSELNISSHEAAGDPVELEPAVAEDDCAEEPAGNPQRVSKARKRRDRKAVKEREREQLIMAQEEENKTGARNTEMQTIKRLLRARGLAVHEIPSDGNCLYAAVDFQRKLAGLPHLGPERLRQAASQYLRGHRDDFLPFLSHPDSGEPLTEQQFDEYCARTADTPAWGGQVELRALSHALRCQIEVVQASGPPIVLGEEYGGGGPRLVVAYHRHMYGLGEHYNSVRPLAPGEDGDPDDPPQEVVGP
ncbi:deubiquitinase OTUD6B [Bacillus rossius redtenbacheri]|uniref:deubiquitinase OTUD6B n=1 Tax=Bacillus rossius redtenbacheri TaxID=93214 RepID=UPI002FDE7CD3